MPRLYKPKNVPKQHPNPIDSPSCSPSCPPGSSTPYGLKRAAEAVSKQISGHKAMVAQFKEMRLPRPTMFSTKSATPPHTDRSLAKKASENGEKPPILPLAKSPTSSVESKQRAPLSRSNTNSLSPAKPPGLSPLSPIKKGSTSLSALSAPNKSKSPQSPIHSLRQRAGATSTTSPTNLATVSITSATDGVDIDEPILFVSCFHSAEEGPELEDDLFETVELSSGFEAQVARIFGRGLGPASGEEVIRRGEVPLPTPTPEASFASTSELMSAIVEWWEPAAIQREVAIDFNSQVRSDGFETTLSPDQKPMTCVPKTVPRPTHPLSSADYEHLASLGRDASGALSLGIRKQSRRTCVIKVISNAIVEEQTVVRAVLEEQRIMCEASSFPFLLGLMASFYDANGFYLVSVSFFSC
jgi:hypothetical protein